MVSKHDHGAMETAREMLAIAQRLSKQGSYKRRAPAPASLPYFQRARAEVDHILRANQNNTEALLMMSQICESMMEFRLAEEYLNRAFGAGEPKTKKMLKRLALLRDNAKLWNDLALSPQQLNELGQFLSRGGVGPAHCTMQLTQEWLTQSGFQNVDSVIESINRRGAYSDYQVLSNLVRG